MRRRPDILPCPLVEPGADTPAVRFRPRPGGEQFPAQAIGGDGAKAIPWWLVEGLQGTPGALDEELFKAYAVTLREQVFGKHEPGMAMLQTELRCLAVMTKLLRIGQIRGRVDGEWEPVAAAAQGGDQ